MTTIHDIARAENIRAVRRFYRRQSRTSFWVATGAVVVVVAIAEFVAACWLVSGITEGVIR